MIAISSIELQVNSEQSRTERDGVAEPRGALTPRVVLRALRPLQWSKNLLLLAAPTAAAVIERGEVREDVATAVVAFCMLSSATYLLNDVRDRDQDRAHPRKRRRPIASGAMPVRVALPLAVALGLGGLALAAFTRLELVAVGCAYLALTASYSLWLRRVIVADMLAIAGGFVLRAVAGGVAANVPLSRWFLVVVSCGAIFVVAGKRHAELFGSAGDGPTRATLRVYSAASLRAVLAAAALGMTVAYAIWAFRRPEHGPFYELSVIPIVLWLCRYGILIGRGAGEAPEELILRDRVLLPLTLGWALLFALGTYVGR